MVDRLLALIGRCESPMTDEAACEGLTDPPEARVEK